MSTTQLLEEYAGVTADDLGEMSHGEFVHAMLEHAPPEWIGEVFDEEDAPKLEVYATLLEDEAFGLLTEESEVLLEGLKKLIGKAKDKIASKIPPGMKMVFGKLVKVAKGAGKAAAAGAKGAVKGAKAVGRGAKAVGRGAKKVADTAVKAKRGAQAATYGLSKAGKEARQLAKEVKKTHGRQAAKDVKKASKAAYQAASRGGESADYARGQAAGAAQSKLSKSKKATYDPDLKKDLDDAKAKADKASAPKKKKGGKGPPPPPPPRGFGAKKAAKEAGRNQ